MNQPTKDMLVSFCEKMATMGPPTTLTEPLKFEMAKMVMQFAERVAVETLAPNKDKVNFNDLSAEEIHMIEKENKEAKDFIKMVNRVINLLYIDQQKVLIKC